VVYHRGVVLRAKRQNERRASAVVGTPKICGLFKRDDQQQQQSFLDQLVATTTRRIMFHYFIDMG
jgi:hypothetical protein